MKKNNMKKILITIISIIIVLSAVSLIMIQNINAATPAVSSYGQLQVKGTSMCDSSGNPVELHGMSFFWSNWDSGYYNSDVVKWLKDDWKCNIIRASMGIDVENGYLENSSAEKQKIFNMIDSAIDQGIYIIVDWHDHSAQDHQSQSIEFFKEVSQKYGDKPNIIYEIYNEPDQESWSQIKPYAQAVVNAIRKNDSDNIIVVGTPQWSQLVNTAASDPINGTNIMYTLHFYAGTHGQWLRDEAVKAMNKGIALFVTEWGTSEASGDGRLAINESNTWLDFMDQYNLSWCNWSLIDKEETSAALKPNASKNGGWNESVLTGSGQYVRGKIKELNGNAVVQTAKPTAEETFKPTDKPTIEPTEKPTTTSSSQSNVSITYAVNDWGNGGTANIVVSNKGSAINGWKLTWNFPGNQKITNMWGGKFTQSGSKVVVTSESWNSSIPKGGNVQFGFNINYTGSNENPTDFVLE